MSEPYARWVENDAVEITRSELLAVSRLLWSIGAEESTSHQHRIDCWHWGAHLDYLAGMPAAPTDERTREDLMTFYEDIQQRVAQRIAALRSEE